MGAREQGACRAGALARWCPGAWLCVALQAKGHMHDLSQLEAVVEATELLHLELAVLGALVRLLDQVLYSLVLLRVPERLG